MCAKLRLSYEIKPTDYYTITYYYFLALIDKIIVSHTLKLMMLIRLNPKQTIVFYRLKYIYQ